MNKYVNLLAENGIKYDGSKLEFNISNDSTKEEYDKHVNVLINYIFYSSYLNDNLVRLYMINDGLLIYKEEMLNLINVTYNLSIKYKDEDATQTLAYIICSLYRSFSCPPYADSDNIENYISEFNKYFPMYKLSKNGEINLYNIEFAKQILEKLIGDPNCSLAFDEIVIDSLNILYRHNEDISEYIGDMLALEHQWYYERIMRIDKNISKNYRFYMDAVLQRLDGFYDEVAILKYLYQKNIVTSDDEKQIIDKVKLIIEQSKQGIDHMIEQSKMERIIKALQNIISISNAPNSFKIKLRELLKQAIFVKKLIIKAIKDEDLHEHTFNIEIPKEEVEKFNADCEKNLVAAITKNCIVNFAQNIKGCVQTRTTYVMHIIADVMHLETDEGFAVRSGDKVAIDSFNRYYNKKITEYIDKEKDNLKNIHILKKEKYYNYLLDYVSEIFNLQVSLVGLWLERLYGEDYEEVVYKELIDRETYSNNYYVMLLDTIINLEFNLTTIYNRLFNQNIVEFNHGILSKIFEKLIENNVSDFFINGFTYINYTIFEPLGIDIRNKLAHGSLRSLNKDNTIFLAVITAWTISHTMLQEFSNA